ncbi:ABC transporter permease [Amorphus orientalis]|uniref:Thiamine transport system permease protein n=1 Tax=Amorphus orientalis TaxID=649198 RepID=A0AAE3VMF4_9HYPH|nr:ABC transporter permease subunit [Amorphus orientalis]MDQ0315189.1 putative thiamine transport system permease protein [Amorphus orientalis]
MVRFAPTLTIAVLIGPVIAGLAGIALPAFGYLPALGRTSFSLSPIADLLAMPGLWRSVRLSLWTGLASTAITCAVTFLFLAGWSQTRAFHWMRRLLSPLLSVPHAAAALGLAFLISPSGWLVRLVSPWATGLDRPPDLLIVHDPAGIAMITALVAKEVPFLLLMALAALPQTDATRLSHVAESFGYGRMAGFAYAVLPRLYSQLRLPIFAIIAFSTSTVDVALVLGPTLPAPLAVRVVDWMNDPDLGRRFIASAGALLQITVTGTALLAWLGLEKIVGLIGRHAISSGKRYRRDGVTRLAGASLALLCVVVIAAGLAGLAVWSVAGFWRFPDALPATFSLDTWKSNWAEAATLFRTTLAIGAIATLLAVFLTLGCLENESRRGRAPGKGTLSLVFVPLMMPQVSMLFGLQILFLTVGLPPTVTTVALAHLVFVLPYVFLALADSWRALDPRYAMVAAALGAGPERTFRRVRLPMMLPAVLTAAAVGFAVSVGQYLPTLVLGAGRVVTVTTEAVALSAGGNRRLVGLFAVLQMVLPLIGFTIALLVPAVLFRNRSAFRLARP